ncbi:MAG: hypothetical protein AAB731_00225, partial [Patescibacteria group bacterium]
KAKKVEAEEFVVNNESGDATVGVGHFNGGQKEILITNSRVEKSSKIFVSFLGNPGGASWISETEDGRFKVELSVPAISDVDFNYWILGVTKDVTSGISSQSFTDDSAQSQTTGGFTYSNQAASEIVSPVVTTEPVTVGDSVPPSLSAPDASSEPGESPASGSPEVTNSSTSTP